ncbi:hypothetical protein Leryth_000627, partial [Lithospermum erythrorhizon]
LWILEFTWKPYNNGLPVCVYSSKCRQVPDASSTSRQVRHVIAPILSVDALNKNGLKVSLLVMKYPKKLLKESWSLKLRRCYKDEEKYRF